MLADSGVELLLTQAHLFERLPGAEGVTPICLDSLKLDNWPSQAPGLHLHGDNLAYVIYTSGSTGLPKGVGNTHAALAERLQWMQATYALDGDDVLMQKAPVSFDVSVWECFWPLVTGCRLVLAAPGEHRDPARLVELVRQFGVTTLHFVPLLLQLFIVYYGLAQFEEVRKSAFWPYLRDPYWCALLTMTLHTAAYIAEILRGAIHSVPVGEVEAARALGMSRRQALWHIILPRAVRIGLPAYSNEVILMLKASAVVYTVTLFDIMGMARTIIARTYESMLFFCLAGALYLVITIVLTRIFRLIERWLRVDATQGR